MSHRNTPPKTLKATGNVIYYQPGNQRVKVSRPVAIRDAADGDRATFTPVPDAPIVAWSGPVPQFHEPPPKVKAPAPAAPKEKKAPDKKPEAKPDTKEK